jgi:hypothetical protein
MTDHFYSAVFGIAPFGGSRPLDMDAIAKRVVCGTHVEPRRSPYFIPPVEPPVAEPVPVVPVVELPPGERAKAWLAAELAEGEPVASVGLLERAVKAGITLSTLRRMAKAMCIRKIKQGRGGWAWALPEGD